ncbi:MAG TPA: protein-L-isoaspartate(D-aspartate) O-methyltransferase [Solirubrobacterales bacterium]|nr:protein-L-isoaspartate(D-aspartate) O-methyltransferase [Solirubrobacterales bacterium]
MVERQLRRRGIGDERVLAAMAEVPREEFVPPQARSRAYSDAALPIGAGQTISQPWIVAAICQALELRGEELVLEIGAGSGYSAAVLARLARRVIGIERHESLAGEARTALDRLGVDNVELLVGDGSRGLPERAPFEAIAVHATAPAPPRTLLGQLADGGRLVVPIAGESADMLTVFRRRGAELVREEIGPCRFVPLVGEEGFAPD